MGAPGPEVHVPGTPKGKALPLLAVVGVPALGYVGWRWYKSRKAATSIVSGQPVASLDASTSTDPVGGISAGVDPSGLLTVGAGGIAPGATSGAGIGAPIGEGLTLDAWGQAAENYLIGTGVSPLDAVSAVNAYEGGQALAPGAMDLINKALGDLGAPPFAPSASLLTDTTPPTETTPIAPTSVPTSTPTLTPSPSPVPTSAPAAPPEPSIVSTPNYLGATSGGSFVDAGVAPSATPTSWSAIPIPGGYQHVGAGGQVFYAPPGTTPNTLPPGAVLPPWASSVQDYFTQ